MVLSKRYPEIKNQKGGAQIDKGKRTVLLGITKPSMAEPRCRLHQGLQTYYEPHYFQAVKSLFSASPPQ